LQQLNRNEEALQVLQQGLQIRPHWELYNNLGTLLFAKADYLGAVRAFEDAVSANKGSPGDYLLWANLADAQRWVPSMAEKSLQSYQRAISLLTPMLERAPENINSLSRMALYQARALQKQQALDSLKKVLKLPETATIAFRAALTFDLLGLRNEAIDALQKAAKLGYPLHLIESEPDLLALRRDARYQQFIINLESERRK
jgi:serine/threonine-protein kinase